jgi:hypothetical protein
MKRIRIVQSGADIISHSGQALIGQALKQHTRLTPELNTRVSLRHGIKHADILKSYIALLRIGKNDFKAINMIESEYYFMSAMDIHEIPCDATLRQRMDRLANTYLPIVEKASRDFPVNIQPT